MEAKVPFLRARRGNVDFFKTVDLEILLKARDEDDKTVLTVAALCGHLDCCEVIVERCTPLLYHQEKDAKWSVLHDVAAFNHDKNVENIMRFLITADSKPDLERGGGGAKLPNHRLLTMQNRWGQTALHWAVNWGNHGATKLLLEADRDFQLLRMVDNNGQTCLHIAVEQDNLDMVKLICKAGLDKQLLSMPDSRGNTPLQLAFKNNNLAIAELFLEARPDNELLKMTTTIIKTALHIAVEKKSLAIVQLLLEADHSNDLLAVVDSHQRTALHYAVEQGHLDMVKLICKAALDKQLLSMPDSRGNTPLHLAMDKAVARDGSGSVSQVICKLILETDPSQCTKQTGDKRWTPLHYAISYGLHSVAEDIIQLCPDCIKAKDFDGRTPYMIATRRIISAECRESSISDSKIIRMLLEKDPMQCTKLEDEHEQPFIHVAVKLGLNDVIDTILKSKEIEATILNIQDKDGNTPLHIAALGQDKCMTLRLLYDARVNKEIENNKKEKAIDLIKFPYDEAKARVYSIGHQSDLKDQSNFDLLVAALIATVSFTAGITVPGGYISDGVNKGSAILLKATAFKVFVVANNIALVFSLYTVCLNFSTRRLLRKGEIYYESKTGTFRTRLLRKADDMIYPLNAATLCTLSAIYAMVVAFITGSYVVLDNSEGLAITVCVISCFFLILALHATLSMAMQYWYSKPVPEVFS